MNAQILAVELHNTCNITEPFEIKVDDYGKDAKILHTGNFAAIIKEKITNPELINCPLIGSMSQIGNLHHLRDDTELRDNIQQLYEDSRFFDSGGDVSRSFADSNEIRRVMEKMNERERFLILAVHRDGRTCGELAKVEDKYPSAITREVNKATYKFKRLYKDGE